MAKIRYAMIGFGGIAENKIAKEGFACDRKRFKALKEAELVGTTDMNPARKKAAETSGLKWYKSSDEILKDKSIDAVFIATNNLSHASIAKTAIKAGKHCIVEKPIATKLKDAKELCALAKKQKRSLAVDHMMTHNSYNEKARELIKNRKLGNVNDICLHMEFSYGSTLAEAKTWRCAKQEELGGPIGDVASHCMYMAEFLLQSKIRSLACVYYPKIMKIKVEDGAYIKFEMENGLAGSLKVSFNEARGGLGGTLSNLGYEIYGDKAVLRGYGTMFQLSGYADEPVKVRLELDEFKKIRGITPGKIKNIYQGVIIEHAKSIKSGKLMDGVDAMHNLELVEAAHKSAKTNGKKLKVS